MFWAGQALDFCHEEIGWHLFEQGNNLRCVQVLTDDITHFTQTRDVSPPSFQRKKHRLSQEIQIILMHGT